MKLQSFYFSAFLDILTAYKVRFFMTALLSGFAIVLQLVAIQSFIMISSDNSVEFAFFNQDDLLEVILKYDSAIWSIFIVSGVLSVCIMYIIKRISVAIMIDYEVRCVNRLAAIMIDKVSSRTLDYGIINILMTKDCRFGGRMAYELSNVVFPISSLFLLFPYLAFLDAGLTILIFTFLLIVGATQLKYSDKVETVASNMEHHAKEDKVVKQSFLRQLADGSFKGFDDKDSIPSPLFMETYRQRLMIPHKGNLIGGGQFILVLAIIGAWFSLLNVNSTPADILVYSVICLFVFSQAKMIPKSLANSIIFFSYFKRVFHIFLNPTESEFLIVSGSEREEIEIKDEEDDML